MDGRAVVERLLADPPRVALRRLLSRPAVSRAVRTPLRRLAPLLPPETFLRVPVVGEFDVSIPRHAGHFRMHSDGDDDVALLAFWHGLEGRPSRPGRPTASLSGAQTLAVLLELGARARTFLDVGANVGLYALAMATAHPGQRVHAFEPAPRTFERLQRNAALNTLPNLALHRQAMADNVGAATLYVPRRAAPLDASLVEGMRPDTEAVVVPTTTVDSFAMDNALTVDLLKLDTEATEDRVLAGASRTLAGDAPFIVCEVLSGERAEPHVGPMLADMGYRAFRITASGPRAISEVRGDPDFVELDFLFAHHSRLDELTLDT
jgi:FkbM family methyltransferase